MFSIFFHFFGFPSMQSFSCRTAALAVRSRSAFQLSLYCVLAVSLLLLPWNAKSTEATNLQTVTVTGTYDPPPVLDFQFAEPFITPPPSGEKFEINRGATKQPTDDKRDKADPCAGERSGNPVVLSTGNKVEQEMDFQTHGEMALFLERTFNAFWNAHGLFGHYWLSNFDYSLVFSSEESKSVAWLQYPDGRRVKFIQSDSNKQIFWENKSQPVAYIEILKREGGSTREDVIIQTPASIVHDEKNEALIFNLGGNIIKRSNEHGVSWTFYYGLADGTRAQDDYVLLSVKHSSGKSIQFTWQDDVVSRESLNYCFNYWVETDNSQKTWKILRSRCFSHGK